MIEESVLQENLTIKHTHTHTPDIGVSDFIKQISIALKKERGRQLFSKSRVLAYTTFNSEQIIQTENQ